MSQRIAIIGAGVAGLAAAATLLKQQPDADVTIYESSDAPGGLASRWNIGNFSSDLGPHRIFTELPEIEALLPELMAHGTTLEVQRRSELLLRGHFYRYPVKPPELLRHLGPITFFRIGIGALLGKFHTETHDTFQREMIRGFGRAAYDLLVGPYAHKVWKHDPSDLAGEVARVRVSAGNVNKLLKRILGGKQEKTRPTSIDRFKYLQGGVEGLVEALVTRATRAGARIATGHALQRIETDTSTQRITRLDFGHATAEPDVVISTAPLPDVARMLLAKHPDADIARRVDELVYIALILVGVVVRRPQATPNSWIYYPEAKWVFNRAYEPRNFDPSMAPADQSMIVFEVTSMPDAEPWTWSDEQIAAAVRRDAVATGTLRDEDISAIHIRRVPHTYPLYDTHFRARLDAICGYLAQFPNLISTGRQGLFNHNNMDHSMLMGIKAAESVQADAANPAQHWHRHLDQFAHFRIVD